MEAGRVTEAMYTFDPVTITEAMGRNTGWIAAATGLAARTEREAPHLIYVPEVPFSVDRFLEDVRRIHARLGYAFVVVSEGIVDEKGDYVAAQATTDAFGHRQLGGAAAYLQQLVTGRLGLKCRHNKLDTCQRNAMHFASKTDSDEAYRCGREAVRHALEGTSGYMVGLVRESDEPYRTATHLTALAEVANGVKKLPRSFLNEEGTHISDDMRDYARPLLRGEVPIRIGSDGLPVFVRFRRAPVPRKLPDFREHR
jgi:6-phosphofructokinase 1